MRRLSAILFAFTLASRIAFASVSFDTATTGNAVMSGSVGTYSLNGHPINYNQNRLLWVDVLLETVNVGDNPTVNSVILDPDGNNLSLLQAISSNSTTLDGGGPDARLFTWYLVNPP